MRQWRQNQEVLVVQVATELSLEQWEVRGCIQKFQDWIDNEIYAYLWYYSLLFPAKGYGGKTH
jgi:hypothetical protein